MENSLHILKGDWDWDRIKKIGLYGSECY